MSYPRHHAHARDEVRANAPVKGTPLARLVIAINGPWPSEGLVSIDTKTWARMVDMARAEIAGIPGSDE